MPQRRNEDILWALRWLDVIMTGNHGTRFAPDYAMTDADKATYNAMVTMWGEDWVKVNGLMCWFHVRQNMWKKMMEHG